MTQMYLTAILSAVFLLALAMAMPDTPKRERQPVRISSRRQNSRHEK